jgi:hypothetical protein
MPSAVIEVLHWPLFPIVIMGLLGWLYWRGVLTYRNENRKNVKPKDGPGSPG